MPPSNNIMLSEIQQTLQVFGAYAMAEHLSPLEMKWVDTAGPDTSYIHLLDAMTACRKAVNGIRMQNDSIRESLQQMDNIYSQAAEWDRRIHTFLDNIYEPQDPEEAIALFRYDREFASGYANRHGYTPFMWACYVGHHEVVKEMLPAAQLRHALYQDRQTALLLAIEGGHTEIAMELIVNGADITQGRNDGYTPLMAAAEFGYTDLVSAILWQAQSDMENPDVTEYVNRSGGGGGKAHWSQTALMWAISAHQLAAAQVIADNTFCEARTVAECGYNALILAATCYDNSEEDLNLFSTLLNDTPNLEEESIATSTTTLFDLPYYIVGYTALLSAAENGCTQKVQMLLERGANPNHNGLSIASCHNYYTPLMAAHGHYDITLLLLKAGADVQREFQLRDGDVVRALHFADGADGHQLIELAERIYARSTMPPLPRSRCSSIGEESDDDMPALISIH
jgi:ankyrin repeat protein